MYIGVINSNWVTVTIWNKDEFIRKFGILIGKFNKSNKLIDKSNKLIDKLNLIVKVDVLVRLGRFTKDRALWHGRVAQAGAGG